MALLAGHLSRLMQARGLKPGQTLHRRGGRWSRLMQARGLKLCQRRLAGDPRQSRLMQARGLKQCVIEPSGEHIRSRLMQARGLKRCILRLLQQLRRVAPHAGAWIETPRSPTGTATDPGRASCRRVD